MCYDDNARPPVPEGATGAAHGKDLVLESADGNRFAAYLATPSVPASAQVLILPDIRGLHQFYKDLALRFAEIGFSYVPQTPRGAAGTPVTMNWNVRTSQVS